MFDFFFKMFFLVAQCFQQKGRTLVSRAYSVTAFVGKHGLINNEPDTIAHAVWDVILHPDWDFQSQNYDADISIAILETEIDLSNPSKIGIVCLPKNVAILGTGTEIITGTGTVVGWVRRDVEDPRSSVLPIELQVPAVTERQCLKTHKIFEDVSSKRMFCAGFNNTNTSACILLAGSGFLTYNRDSNIHELAGMISSAIFKYNNGHMCDTNTYTLFTNIEKFTPWIARKMNESIEKHIRCFRSFWGQR